MTPGLAFFYGGLVNRKNVLTIMMQSFISMGVVTLIWTVIGFSMAFGTDVLGVIGNLQHAFIASYFILFIVNKFSKIRVSAEDELRGLDSSIHGEDAYRI